MPKTKIEWCDYTINPVKGKCPMGCPYCYARRLYDRFKWNPEMRLDLSVFDSPNSVKKPSRVFVGSTFELFHESVPWEWQFEIMQQCKAYATYTDHAFLFLTKQPQNLIKWSPFPENCWVGVTVTNEAMFSIASNYMTKIKARVKFYSFEPLLKWDFKAYWDKENMCLIRRLRRIDWLIIGQQTPVSKKTEPKIEWIQEIVEAADKVGIPVFLKDNLRPLLENDPLNPLYWANISDDESGNERVDDSLRQEFPKVMELV